MDETAPVTFNSPYYQISMSGIEGGGYGFIVYLPVKEPSDVVLEEAYFKGKKLKLERKKNEAVYVGRYTDPKSLKVRNGDLIMSGNRNDELKNEAPVIEESIPFQLKEGECIIGYVKDGNKGYFKLDKLPEKELKGYPMQIRQ
ncbi:hypothetical protein QBK95_12270 [Aquimarina sp. 2201CG14-23]|nr:hypothetical protein [Aquimarina sp. 2201CG14-23]